MAYIVRIFIAFFLVLFSACRSVEDVNAYVIIPPRDVLTLIGECDIECETCSQGIAGKFEKSYVDTISKSAADALSLKKLRKLKLTYSYSPIRGTKVSINLSGRVESLDGIHIKTYHSSVTEEEGGFYSSVSEAIFVASARAFQKAVLGIFEQMKKEDIVALQDASIKEHNERIRKENEERARAEEDWLKIEGNRRAFLIDEFGEKQACLILEGKIAIGMTEAALLKSWGRPRRINESVGPWGVHKQYVYRSAYVYVENGRVVSWQIEK